MVNRRDDRRVGWGIGRWWVFILVIALMPSAVLVAEGDSSVQLFVGRSTIVDVGAAISRVSLTSADVADALVTAPSQLLINGKAPGTISMFVWDRSGAVKRYEVVVQRDIARLTAQMKELFPNERIEVQGTGRNVVLAGRVSTKDVMDRAVELAAGYVEAKDEVVDLLQLQGGTSNQVLLRVRFAEVSRTALTQLGSSFLTGPGGVQGAGNVAQTSTGQFPASSFGPFNKGTSPPGDGPTTQTFSDILNLFFFNSKYNIGAIITALKQKGLFQDLAEPNLIAETGNEASFLAGGEIPVPVAQPSGGAIAITIQWKEYGVRLNFTPTVLANGQVQLKVRPEVSTLDYTNAITLSGFTIPALSTRRTETQVELQDGQTFAISGLLDNQITQTLSRVPGIGDVPVLGALFRSKQVQKAQTELVVMITPEILPNNSPGVTPSIPPLAEPFIPPMTGPKVYPVPPPAFQPSRPDGTAATTPKPVAPSAPAAGSSSSVMSPAAAAAALAALNPPSRTVVNGDLTTSPATASASAVSSNASTTAPADATAPTSGTPGDGEAPAADKGSDAGDAATPANSSDR